MKDFTFSPSPPPPKKQEKRRRGVLSRKNIYILFEIMQHFFLFLS